MLTFKKLILLQTIFVLSIVRSQNHGNNAYGCAILSGPKKIACEAARALRMCGPHFVCCLPEKLHPKPDICHPNDQLKKSHNFYELQLVRDVMHDLSSKDIDQVLY